MGRPGAHARADAPAAAASAAAPHRRVRGQGAAPRGHPLRRLGDVLLHRRVHRPGVVGDPRLRGGGRARPGPAQRGRAGAAVHRLLLRGGHPPRGRVRRRVLRRAGLERGDAGVRGPRHPGAVRRADRRPRRRRRAAPGLLPVQLRGRAGAPAGHRGAAAAQRDPRGSRLMERVTVLAARAEREAAGRPVVDKRTTAEDAAGLIRDGDHVAIGGTLYSRTPMALVFALLRRRRRRLTVSRPLACYEIELFLATSALDRIVTSWVGIGLPWGLALVFRQYVERGEARYDEWSHLAMGLRYKAGAMGVPFLPSLTMLGSDLARALDLQTVDCPYTGEQLAAVPALNPDVALIHAHRADMFGNVQVEGYRHMDADIAKAARKVIVSAERIVSPEEIASSPAQTMLPHFAVDAIVAAPHGSYPHECYGLYGPDFGHFTAYATAAKERGPAGALRYVEENVDGHADFAAFIAAAGPERLAALAADAGELMGR